MKIEANLIFKTEEEKELVSACYDTISSINFIGGCYGLPHIASSYVVDADTNTTTFTVEANFDVEDLKSIQDKFSAININGLEGVLEK
jgi:hypothetical protein